MPTDQPLAPLTLFSALPFPKHSLHTPKKNGLRRKDHHLDSGLRRLPRLGHSLLRLVPRQVSSQEARFMALVLPSYPPSFVDPLAHTPLPPSLPPILPHQTPQPCPRPGQRHPPFLAALVRHPHCGLGHGYVELQLAGRLGGSSLFFVHVPVFTRHRPPSPFPFTFLALMTPSLLLFFFNAHMYKLLLPPSHFFSPFCSSPLSPLPPSLHPSLPPSRPGHPRRGHLFCSRQDGGQLQAVGRSIHFEACAQAHHGPGGSETEVKRPRG